MRQAFDKRSSGCWLYDPQNVHWTRRNANTCWASGRFLRMCTAVVQTMTKIRRGVFCVCSGYIFLDLFKSTKWLRWNRGGAAVTHSHMYQQTHTQYSSLTRPVWKQTVEYIIIQMYVAHMRFPALHLAKRRMEWQMIVVLSMRARVCRATHTESNRIWYVYVYVCSQSAAALFAARSTNAAHTANGFN